MNHTDDSIEQLLRDALHHRTASVVDDRSSRTALAVPSRPDRRNPGWLAAAATATAVGGVVLTATLLPRGSEAPRTDTGTPAAGLAAAPAGPLLGSGVVLSARTDVRAPTDRDRNARRLVIFRATTGKIVARVPDVYGPIESEPVLSPDGSRLFGVWGNGLLGVRHDATLGYIEVATGRRVVLAQRKTQLGPLAVSADGATLAYQSSGDGGAEAEVVVRDLMTGREHRMTPAPGGPQGMVLALSPDGSQLAVAATDTFPRRLLLLASDAADFRLARAVTPAPCRVGTGQLNQPRWTSGGLFAVQHCAEVDRPRLTADLATVDVGAGRATVARTLPPAPIFVMTVLDAPVGRLFVTADETLVDHVTVVVRNSSRGWSTRRVAGLFELAVASAE